MNLIRLSRWLVLMALAALLALPLAAQDDTPEEDPTNPDYRLPILEPDEVLDDVLAEGSNAQLYGFYGSAGDSVSISVIPAKDGTFDPYVVLVGPYGQVIAYDDDGGEVAFAAQITDAELPANGSYYVLVTNFFDLRSGPTEEDLEAAVVDQFTITISGFTLPPEDQRQFGAGRLVVDAGANEGYSTLAEPVYYYTLVVLPGDEPQLIDLEMSSEDIDTLLMVFGPGGVRLAVNDDSGGSDSALEGVELPEAGKYLIFATSYAFQTAADEDVEYTEGNFTISASSAK